MKTSRYFITAAAAGILLPLFSSCMPMLDTSLSMSPAPGVNVGVGVSTPIPGPWSDGLYSPFWGGGIAGIPAWGLGPATAPPLPSRPVVVRPPVQQNRPVTLPSQTPVPSGGAVRPYPTEPGPVTGGTGLLNMRPGAAGNGGGGNAAVTPPSGGGSFRRPYLRN